MKLETILNAMEWAKHDADFYWQASPPPFDVKARERFDKMFSIRTRQYRAFRDRIIRMDAEKDDYIDWTNNKIERLAERIVVLEDLRSSYVNQVNEKDARIAELEDLVEQIREYFGDQT